MRLLGGFLGRLFGPDEQSAVVLSHRTFKRKFNAEPSELGRTVTLNGYPVTIVGVLARDYRVAFPAVLGGASTDSAAYIALPNTPSQPGAADRNIPGGRPVSAWVRVVGELRPDVPIEQGRTELQGIYDQIARDFPTPLREGRTLRVMSLLEKVVSPVKTPLKIVLVAVAFILMIANTNINAPVLTFAAVAALVSTVLFGIAPGVSLLRTDLTSALKREDKMTSPTPGVRRIRGLFVTLELTLATALLIAAGLMLKSFWVMSSGPPGFDPEKTLVTRVSLSGPRYARRVPQEQYAQELLQRLEGVPGISAVGIDAGSFNSPVKVDGVPPETSDPAPDGQTFAAFKPVSLGLLRAIGVPLIRGRWPSDSALSSDAIESTDALLVNQRFVETVLRGHEPIGRHVSGPYVSGTIAGVEGFEVRSTESGSDHRTSSTKTRADRARS